MTIVLVARTKGVTTSPIRSVLRRRARPSVPLALALAVPFGCGGGEGAPEPDVDRRPAVLVRDAARASLALEPAAVTINTESPQGAWEGEGLVEPTAGRFRVVAEGQVFGHEHNGSLTVVGMREDGSDVALAEENTTYQGEPQRCWMGTHAPVGSNRATASVQEAVWFVVWVLAAVAERAEGARAAAAGEGSRSYRVPVRSTARQRRDFRQSNGSFFRRQDPLGSLRESVGVTVSEERRVEEVALRLDRYVPVYGWEARELDPRPVSIRATLAATDDELDLTPAPCQGTE